MPEEEKIPISMFPDATTINGEDVVTGLHDNANFNFKMSGILAWLVNAVRLVFVPIGRTVNNKSLSSDITLTASDVGAQDEIVASGILKGDGQGGVSAAVAGTDYQAPLTAGTDYATPAMIPSVPSISTSTPQMDGTGAAGSTGEVSDAGHTHPSDTSKANASSLANSETGTTASKNYYVGDYFTKAGILNRVISPISAGQPFILNTNYIPDVAAGHAYGFNIGNGITIQTSITAPIGLFVFKRATSFAMYAVDYWGSGASLVGGAAINGLTISKNANSYDVTIYNGTGIAFGCAVIK